jgi:hypothetical protein
VAGGPSRAKPLARLALAGVAVYVAMDVLLAFLGPSPACSTTPKATTAAARGTE